MNTNKMYSPTHCRTVTLEFVTCPRCKGFGRTLSDSRNDDSCICDGNGELWHDSYTGCYSLDLENIDIW